MHRSWPDLPVAILVVALPFPGFPCNEKNPSFITFWTIVNSHLFSDFTKSRFTVNQQLWHVGKSSKIRHCHGTLWRQGGHQQREYMRGSNAQAPWTGFNSKNFVRWWDAGGLLLTSFCQIREACDRVFPLCFYYHNQPQLEYRHLKANRRNKTEWYLFTALSRKTGNFQPLSVVAIPTDGELNTIKRTMRWLDVFTSQGHFDARLVQGFTERKCAAIVPSTALQARSFQNASLFFRSLNTCVVRQPEPLKDPLTAHGLHQLPTKR